MHTYEPTPVDDYLRYYQNQIGFGQPHPGITVYKGSSDQKGNGLGSILRTVWNSLTPLLRSNTVKSALRSTGKSALNIGNDLLQGKEFEPSLNNRLREAGVDLLSSAAHNLRGSGKRR